MKKMLITGCVVAAGMLLSACTTYVTPVETVQVPVGPKFHRVWVPGHYDRFGGWVPGHYRR